MSQPPSQADIDALFAGGASSAAPKIDDVISEVPMAPDFSPSTMAAAGYSAPLETLLDVSMPVTIEFGRTNMTVQEVLQLATGSVIQLQRMVGEPIDIYVSDRKLAEGEVVVIGEHFGVRITKIMVGTEQTQS